MIRAVIFDFYSVVIPDVFENFEKELLSKDEQSASKIQKQLDDYFMGLSTFEYLTGALEYISGNEKSLTENFKLFESDIPEIFIKLVEALHMHFLKVSIIANIGEQEISLLSNFNEQLKEFDLIAGPSTYGDPLLSESFFKAALKDLGEPPQNCLLISGHQDYLNFAKQISMNVYRFIDFNDVSRYLKLIVNSKP